MRFNISREKILFLSSWIANIIFFAWRILFSALKLRYFTRLKVWQIDKKMGLISIVKILAMWKWLTTQKSPSICFRTCNSVWKINYYHSNQQQLDKLVHSKLFSAKLACMNFDHQRSVRVLCYHVVKCAERCLSEWNRKYLFWWNRNKP